MRLIRSGEADVALSGGTEAVTLGDGDFAPAWYYGQAQYGMMASSEDADRTLIPFDRDRSGIVIGDGSAMYTIQALWTQAREGLPVTTIIFANNSYAILKAEYANMGAGDAPGPQALAMIDIDRPTIDWVAMGKSMGVPGVSVDTVDGFTAALTVAVSV